MEDRRRRKRLWSGIYFFGRGVHVASFISVNLSIVNDIAPLSYDSLVNLDDASTNVDWKYL